MAKTYLLTGGTGFLGSLLSLELIKRGGNIIFLGRRKNGENFEKRIKNILKSIDSQFSTNNIETVEIDLYRNDLGLTEEFIDKFRGKISGIWHLAANLSFREKDRKEIFSTNIGGLKNILNLAETIKSPVFYTSTAYVHGQRPGVIYEEDIIKPKHFNNSYEESKFEGEMVIKKWGEKENNKFIIFRPSIFIERKRKALSFFGYYAIVYALYKIKQKLGNGKKIFFIPFLCSKKCFLNLMPIDIAINWMLKISFEPKAIGKTFHITNPSPFSMKEISEQTFRALDMEIPIIKAPGWFIRFCFSLLYFLSFLLRPIRSLAKKFYYYKYYMTEYNIYDMKNTKEIMGNNLTNQFQFSPNFIENIAREFIDKIKKYK